ncbi:4'-phosphopantetheinyl transferase family protein [Streptomyces canus]|uniref:4'-phosphopantetheinyl transferase EntD n=1 Tax=Streptomyces canus TaxID=58343 RepID=A0AAW8FRI3_9ACTN|nr:4'-phosphopantetheinyl transferase superfamily protein [Streptomyces canus]MDQ0758940.1 4'-phosphopantetheinyl transferase EntD [Streptomyces canus]MDQ0912444.1 4'-phosphopantetheinyl transferase EntD [Streptomyces canus]MDQ1072431.1 4'-phosphopantetheinyl transferase EntD [Streptomyces canus]
MLERILPTEVACAEAFDDPPGQWLFPEEAAVISGAVARRRAEFTTVRSCARRALGTLGVPPVPLLPGARGAPRWPAGIRGSMTHCEGYRGAAVALAAPTRWLGVDAEPNAPVGPAVLDMIAGPAELIHLAALDQLPGALVHWDRLLFSAKESLYKAWFPMAGCLLDFLDAEVELHVCGTFTARVLTAPPTAPAAVPRRYEGRWLLSDGFLCTSVAN